MSQLRAIAIGCDGLLWAVGAWWAFGSGCVQLRVCSRSIFPVSPSSSAVPIDKATLPFPVAPAASAVPRLPPAFFRRTRSLTPHFPLSRRPRPTGGLFHVGWPPPPPSAVLPLSLNSLHLPVFLTRWLDLAGISVRALMLPVDYDHVGCDGRGLVDLALFILDLF